MKESIAIEHIPDELKSREQWVCWQSHDRDGKPAKMPIDPKTGNPASTTDPDTWASFSTALLHYGPRVDRIDGLGFVFSESGSFVGVDIDGCIDDAGELDETAAAIVARLDSYTERSPSGRGLHLIVEGELPDGANRRDNVELYDRDRFFTVTGHHVDGTPPTVEQRQDELEAIHAEYIGEPSVSEAETVTTEIITGGGGGESLDPLTVPDRVLIEKAKMAKNGPKFTRLWNGDTSGYDSHSEADLALCDELVFWTGGDRERVDRLFQHSGLNRDKWDEQRGSQTYGERTIDKALNYVDNYFDPDFGNKSTPR